MILKNNPEVQSIYQGKQDFRNTILCYGFFKKNFKSRKNCCVASLFSNESLVVVGVFKLEVEASCPSEPW